MKNRIKRTSDSKHLIICALGLGLAIASACTDDPEDATGVATSNIGVCDNGNPWPNCDDQQPTSFVQTCPQSIMRYDQTATQCCHVTHDDGQEQVFYQRPNASGLGSLNSRRTKGPACSNPTVPGCTGTQCTYGPGGFKVDQLPAQANIWGGTSRQGNPFIGYTCSNYSSASPTSSPYFGDLIRGTSSQGSVVQAATGCCGGVPYNRCSVTWNGFTPSLTAIAVCVNEHNSPWHTRGSSGPCNLTGNMPDPAGEQDPGAWQVPDSE